MAIFTCARDGCGEQFVRLSKNNTQQKYCSPRCSKTVDRERKRNGERELPKSPRPQRARRTQDAPKLDARPCRECSKPSSSRCGRIKPAAECCRPVFEELRRCEECQKPFRAISKAAKFCGPDCRAIWHDRAAVHERQGVVMNLPAVIDDERRPGRRVSLGA